MKEDKIREDTRELAFDDIGAAHPPPASLTTDRGTVTYDIPPEQRGHTIVIDCEERSEPGLEHQSVPCCTGAMQASLHQQGRRVLCLTCATVYQYGYKVDYRPDIQRRMMGRRAAPFDIWKR